MDKKDLIPWSGDYLLKWSDFKAESNPAVFQDSFSTINYHPTWTVNSEMIEGKIFYFIETIQLTTQFLRHLSWVREQQATNFLLKHEQGHFDLAESFKHKIIVSFKHDNHLYYRTGSDRIGDRCNFCVYRIFYWPFYDI